MNGFIRRSIAALAIIIVVIIQSIHLIFSVLAFDRVWHFVGLLMHSRAGRLEAGLTIIASLAPLFLPLLVVYTLGNGFFESPRKGSCFRFLAALITGYYLTSIVLLTYRLEAGIALDPLLIWLHFRDVWKTVLILARPHAVSLFVAAAVACLYFTGIARSCRFFASLQKINAGSGGKIALLASLALFAFLQWAARSSLASLILEFHQPQSEARILYSQYFQDSIRRNQKQSIPVTSGADQPHLFVFQLESLNAHLVNPRVTPQLLKIAQNDGVLFSRIQSSSVFTILAKETLLCSTLPTVGRNLSLSRELFGTLVCLPQIMRQMGYKTFYFQNFPNADFANANQFLESIGFEERHAADVMRPGDTQIGWGYLEDIFYQRVFEYLERYRGQKIFAYILVGATNHYPFEIDSAQQGAIRALGGLPHPAASGIRERVENTTFLQDHYFGKAYQEHFRPVYGADSHAIVLGDHSWPIAVHPGNENNLSMDGAYQENFVTSLAILPARAQRKQWKVRVGKTVTGLRSQLDFLPTIMELYGIRGGRYYGSSFFMDLVEEDGNSVRRNCLVSVQPFAGGSIAILRDSLKHIYNLRAGTVKTYDLARDPDELRKVEAKIDSRMLQLLDRCLAEIKNANSAPAS